MSGHSKWANIKRQKQANDLIRGKVFSKLSRAITLAVIEGGGITEPEHNVKLRLAIEKARQFNMPKDNILRAIERGLGPDKAKLKENIYEAYGPEGSAFVIMTTTDNPNRTSSEIRAILEHHEGKMAGQGSVLYLFRKCALLIFDRSHNEEEIFRVAEELNAFDIEERKNYFYIYFPFENLGKVKNQTAEVDFRPLNFLKVSNVETAKKIVSLIESLEDHDDVQKVFTNIDLSEFDL